jgi:hypothetical protein
VLPRVLFVQVSSRFRISASEGGNRVNFGNRVNVGGPWRRCLLNVSDSFMARMMWRETNKHSPTQSSVSQCSV